MGEAARAGGRQRHVEDARERRGGGAVAVRQRDVGVAQGALHLVKVVRGARHIVVGVERIDEHR